MNHFFSTLLKMIYYSQKGQDEWVLSVLSGKRNGYFVDLAASDGVRLSNTYTMEKFYGWSGILIEPNTHFYSLCKKNRTSTVIDAVVDEVSGETVCFRSDNMELGGIVAEDTDNNYEIRGDQLSGGSSVLTQRNTLSLGDILSNNNAPNVMDYLSLDIEGAETRALRTFPFDEYTFLTMTIERPTVELENILFQNGYHFVMKSKKMGFDSFYVHESIPGFNQIQLETYESTPKKVW